MDESSENSSSSWFKTLVKSKNCPFKGGLVRPIFGWSMNPISPFCFLTTRQSATSSDGIDELGMLLWRGILKGSYSSSNLRRFAL